MSQQQALREMDADLHSAFQDVGLAEIGDYWPPDAGPDASATLCRVYVDRGIQVFGEFGQITGRRDEIAFLLEDVTPRGKGTVTVDGVSYVLGEKVSENESASRWVVRRE